MKPVSEAPYPSAYRRLEAIILRSRDWSQFDFIGEALRIRQLARGSAFLKPTARETYLVEKSLDVVRDLGSRLFFGLNLALAPNEGCSFAEGVDLQFKGVDFAMSLPKVEKDEWLRHLPGRSVPYQLAYGGSQALPLQAALRAP